MKNNTITGVLMDEDTTISFTQVCRTCHISEETLIELFEHGLFSRHFNLPIEQVQFNLIMLNRLHSARRLQADLGVNLPGVVLALELRDELEKMREELNFLRRHLGGA